MPFRGNEMNMRHFCMLCLIASSRLLVVSPRQYGQILAINAAYAAAKISNDSSKIKRSGLIDARLQQIIIAKPIDLLFLQGYH